MHRRSPTAATFLAVGLATVALTGCTGQGNAESGNAESAAQDFARAAQASPVQGCQLLAPETRTKLEDDEGPCEQSLPEQEVGGSTEVDDVQVYGKDAIVHLADDTIFLARFDDGWRVTAAGCEPVPDRPYDCTIEGS